MARLRSRGMDSGLREFLLAWQVEFREMYVDRIPECADVLSRPVERLTRGEAFSFARFLLPDDHPARFVGGLSDRLTLTTDDRLIDA